MNKGSVRILPETDQNAICVSYSGVITRNEYADKIEPLLHERMAKKKKIKILISYDDFKGWEEDAAVDNLSEMSNFGKHSEKVAYVNAPPSKKKLMETISKSIAGEIRYFDDYKDAVKWVKA
jgi:hypothetical protein